jgi:hypothetical protein
MKKTALLLGLLAAATAHAEINLTVSYLRHEMTLPPNRQSIIGLGVLPPWQLNLTDRPRLILFTEIEACASNATGTETFIKYFDPIIAGVRLNRDSHVVYDPGTQFFLYTGGTFDVRLYSYSPATGAVHAEDPLTDLMDQPRGLAVRSGTNHVFVSAPSFTVSGYGTLPPALRRYTRGGGDQFGGTFFGNSGPGAVSEQVGAIAIGPDGRLNVLDTGRQEILRYDAETLAYLGAIPLVNTTTDHRAMAISFTGYIFTAHLNSTSGVIYDYFTGAYVGTFTGPSGNPNGLGRLVMAADATGNVYVSNSVATRSLVVFSTAALPDHYVTTPVGYFRATFAAGTGTARKVTAFAPPLEFPAHAITGLSTGAIASVTANTITVTGAGWTPAQLTAPATPYLIKFTTGAATGRTFLLSTTTPNTADTVTLAAEQADLTALGVAATDTFELLHCDTLAGLLGTPATTGILGGTTAASADNVVLVADGVQRTYYYNTTLNRWTLDAAGSPDASDTPLLPDTGLLYSRLAGTPLELIVTGRAPTRTRVAEVKNSGPTLLSQNWPADLTLAASNLNRIPGWITSTAASAADKVKLYLNDTLYTYWHDGTNWRRQTLGSPVSNHVVLPAASAVTLERTGTATGRSTLVQVRPE